MNKNTTKKHLTLLTLLFVMSLTFAQTQGTRPNIIIILADDLGYGDVGFNRDASFPADRGIIPTPNIDALASQGVILKNAHVAHPFCGPSRASIMTGVVPHRIGAQYNLPNDITTTLGIPTSETYFPKILQTSGYNTAAFGKWHLGFIDGAYQPLDRGFDHFFGFLGGGKNYFESVYEDSFYTRLGGSNPVTNEYQDPIWRDRAYVSESEFSDAPNEDYLTDLLTDDAIAYATANAPSTDPYFMYLSYNAPHTPLQAPDAERAKFLADNPNFETLVRNSDYIINSAPVTKLTTQEEKDAKIEEFVQARITYATMVTNMDTNIGRLIDVLDNDPAEFNNTLIIFLSDNGGYTYSKGAVNYPLDALKGSVKEGGHKVPMFVRWPNKITATTTPYNHQISALDLYPTLVNLAGTNLIPEGKTLDGVDFMDKLIANEDARKDEAVLIMRPYSGFHNGGLAMGQWKIVKTGGNGAWKLYNILSDPGETTDLRSSEPNAELIIQNILDQAITLVSEFKNVKPGWFDNDGDGTGHPHSFLWDDGTLPGYDRLFESTSLELDVDTEEVSIIGTTNGAEPDIDGEFKVSLPDGILASENIIVNYAVTGTALEGTDYTTLSGSVTILNGENSALIPVEVKDDSTVEPNETVIITLTSVNVGSVNTTPAEIEIADTFVPGVETTLSAGDIAFVGFNSSTANNEHDFAFMILKDITTNTTITFCDKGWKASGGWLAKTDGNPYAVDDIITWTADKAYNVGDIITIKQSKAYVDGTEVGTDAVTQSLGTGFMNFNASGDVLYAYQGSEPVDESNVDQFIAVLGMNGELCVGGGNTAGCSPSNLTIGTHGLEIVPELNNAVYKGAIDGSATNLRLAINNAANWESSDGGTSEFYDLKKHTALGDIGVSGSLSVKDEFLNNAIVVYPNPTKTNARVKVSNGLIILSSTLKSISGVTLKSSTTEIVNLENVSSGVYFITVKTNKGSITKKIIKM